MTVRNLIAALGLLFALPASAATPLDTAYSNVSAASSAAAKAGGTVAADQAAVASAATAVAAAQNAIFPAASIGAVVTGNATLVTAVGALNTAQAKLATDTAALSTAQATLAAQVTALSVAVAAVDSGIPVPVASESANDASVPPLAALVDANGTAWTLTTGGQIAQAGVVDAKTGKVVQLVYFNHEVWQNAFNLWWGWNGTAWTPTGGTGADPRVASTTQAPPSGGRPFILGNYMDPPDQPTWSSFMGSPPDFTIGESYMGPQGGGSNPCNAVANNGNGGYPTVIGMGPYDATSSMPDPFAAANGSYNSVYAKTVAGLSCASTLYAVRIAWEWPGFWFDFSPSWNGNGGAALPPAQWVPPATWIAGFRNLAAAFRANPATAHMKISWDYPMLQYGGAAALAYYPGDDVVDIISADYYFNPQYDGATSAQAWAKATGPGGLNDMAAFALAHGKPMAFWEWADMYTDGNNTQRFFQWMAGENVVAVAIWDSNDAIGGGNTAALNSNAARKAAAVAAFGGTKYTGTFWKPIALPATLLPGY